MTNALFQVTALDNNMHDAAALEPDLSTGRAVSTLFLFMPGTTPGIFLFVVFGTTASSRRKLADLCNLESWREWLEGLGWYNSRRHRMSPSPRGGSRLGDGGIHVQRSLTVTSVSRARSDHGTDDDDDDDVYSDPYPDPGHISMSNLPRRPASSARSPQASYMKPLPLTPQPPSSRFKTTAASSAPENSPTRHGWSSTSTMTTTTTTMTTNTRARELAAPPPSEKRKKMMRSAASADTLARTISDDDYYHTLGPEHSDDSGPILPIQRQEEVRFSRGDSYVNRARGRAMADDKYLNSSSRSGNR